MRTLNLLEYGLINHVNYMTEKDLLREWFKVKKWKWYLVDLRDFHHPVIVRKHLDSKLQAIWYRDKYYDKYFDVVDWKTAWKYGLRDYINKKRRHKWKTAKYNYPEGCNTTKLKKNFRENERKKMRQKKRRPKITETAVWEILDDRPSLFIKRLKHYRDNHWAYSQPVEGLILFKKRFEWPKDIKHLCNIVRVLQEYYDYGRYNVAELAIFIYKKWGKKIRKYGEGTRSIPQDHEKISKEFRRRGFVEWDEVNFDEEDSYIKTIHIEPTLFHPEVCWHRYDEIKLYDHRVFDFQAGMGIPGYTEAHQAGLDKRK